MLSNFKLDQHIKLSYPKSTENCYFHELLATDIHWTIRFTLHHCQPPIYPPAFPLSTALWDQETHQQHAVPLRGNTSSTALWDRETCPQHAVPLKGSTRLWGTTIRQNMRYHFRDVLKRWDRRRLCQTTIYFSTIRSSCTLIKHHIRAK